MMKEALAESSSEHTCSTRLNTWGVFSSWKHILQHPHLWWHLTWNQVASLEDELAREVLCILGEPDGIVLLVELAPEVGQRHLVCVLIGVGPLPLVHVKCSVKTQSTLSTHNIRHGGSPPSHPCHISGMKQCKSSMQDFTMVHLLSTSNFLWWDNADLQHTIWSGLSSVCPCFMLSSIHK